MSSPLAKIDRTLVDRVLIDVHTRASHGTRVEILARLVAQVIEKQARRGPLVCLDVGCGDLTLSRSVGALLPRTSWRGVDIHPLDASRVDDPAWAHYQQFNGEALPFEDASIDVVLVCDVLHHASPQQRLRLVRELGRVSRGIIIIKDHFEYGPVSRQMLRLMDWVGNRGYGVSVPDSYFTPKSFALTMRKGRLVEIDRIVGIHLYGHLGVFARWLDPKWQMLAVLKPEVRDPVALADLPDD